MVMSASRPPLAAMITAVRNRMSRWASGGTAGSSWQRSRSLAHPSGSRERIMFRASLRFFPPVSSHVSVGRTTSAPTATSSELVISSRRDRE